MRDAIVNLQSLYQLHGRVFSMALLHHRMCLVVLVYETINVNHQLGASRPAVVRRQMAAPANKITCSLPLHVLVVQDSLHVKAFTNATVRVQQWLLGGAEKNINSKSFVGVAGGGWSSPATLTRSV